uniref:Uncharacterized protein n=1 Tax=Oryza glumipatula TaxID=40148 RepID=A0A0D9Z3Y4_9ORYZ
MEEIISMELILMEEFNSLLDGGPKQYLQGKTLPTQNIDMHKYDMLQCKCKCKGERKGKEKGRGRKRREASFMVHLGLEEYLGAAGNGLDGAQQLLCGSIGN